MYPTELFGVLGLWVGLILMLMIYSYPLWKENPAYRFAEYTFVSTSLAIILIVAVSNVIKIAILPLLAGNISLIIPIALGAFMYSLFAPKYRYLSRFPLAILIGAAFGLGMRGVLIPSILNQISSTITAPSTSDLFSWGNFTYVAIGTIFSIMYFFLTYEHSGALSQPTKIGRYIIMIGLGAYFGNTIMFRFAMLTGRAEYLLQVLKIIGM